MEIILGHLVLGVSFFLLTLYFKRSNVDSINHLIGYRTPLSMKNKDTWEEANKYSLKLQYQFSLFFLLIELISYLLIGGMVSFYLCSGLLTIISIAVIPLTELHLKKTFNKDGERL